MIGSQRKTIAIYKELEKEGIAAEKTGPRVRSGGVSTSAPSLRKRSR